MLFACLCLSVSAQPTKSRVQQNATTTTTTARPATARPINAATAKPATVTDAANANANATAAKPATATAAKPATSTAAKASTAAKTTAARPATAQQRTATRQQTKPAVSRASIMFPTAVEVPSEVIWRRDIYRELDLTKDENAALYYPVEPLDGRVNLFTLLFQLLNTGKIPAYNYDLNGLENFSQSNRMHFKDMLDRYGIYYEINGNSINVNPSDVPSAEVLSYYVKESSYYDQNTSTYHSRVVAICPVLHRGDDFSFDVRKNPLFWVKIEDVEGYLSQNMVMTSNINNAATMSMADFFATNKYKGTIYMTTNMQGKSLQETIAAEEAAKQQAEELSPADSAQTKALANAQNRIEKEMADFEEHIWTTPVDSAELARRDSIAAAEAAAKKAKKSAKTTTSRAANRTTVKAEKAEKAPKASSGDSGSAAPRVSVRRERH